MVVTLASYGGRMQNLQHVQTLSNVRLEVFAIASIVAA